ncbi:unnamed protein product [Didymodactylos carnosus]|uniref:ATP-dependent DNA helicase n=1 Tax=Didymodactylos carnosus TaxID=1234261 RepID=A0A816DQL8_9BILA|nr:unnamed protein product [Didymodactylos carnosus]CAF4549873.1 unnamed protein product [Didymodactylos carnosus]
MVRIPPLQKRSARSDRITLDTLELEVDAKVMLTRNTNIPDGFANGSFCTVIDFLYNDEETVVVKIVLRSEEERVGVEHS